MGFKRELHQGRLMAEYCSGNLGGASYRRLFDFNFIAPIFQFLTPTRNPTPPSLTSSEDLRKDCSRLQRVPRHLYNPSENPTPTTPSCENICDKADSQDLHRLISSNKEPRSRASHIDRIPASRTRRYTLDRKYNQRDLGGRAQVVLTEQVRLVWLSH